MEALLGPQGGKHHMLQLRRWRARLPAGGLQRQRAAAQVLKPDWKDKQASWSWEEYSCVRPSLAGCREQAMYPEFTTGRSTTPNGPRRRSRGACAVNLVRDLVLLGMRALPASCDVAAWARRSHGPVSNRARLAGSNESGRTGLELADAAGPSMPPLRS